MAAPPWTVEPPDPHTSILHSPFSLTPLMPLWPPSHPSLILFPHAQPRAGLPVPSRHHGSLTSFASCGQTSFSSSSPELAVAAPHHTKG